MRWSRLFAITAVSLAAACTTTPDAAPESSLDGLRNRLIKTERAYVAASVCAGELGRPQYGIEADRLRERRDQLRAAYAARGGTLEEGATDIDGIAVRPWTVAYLSQFDVDLCDVLIDKRLRRG